MRVAAPILVLLAAAPLMAGCLGGPEATFAPTCPSWIEWPPSGGGTTNTGMVNPQNPFDPSSWHEVDNSLTKNGTTTYTPIVMDRTFKLDNGRVLTLDRVQFSFNYDKHGAVASYGGNLTLSFTREDGKGPDGGRRLDFQLIGLPDALNAAGKAQTYTSFAFSERVATNFTVHVMMDKDDGSPDPGGVYAHWDFEPNGTPKGTYYSYLVNGLYDTCEGK